MAKFDEAYEVLKHWEGGYVNDKDDSGGETIFGIARKFHPNNEIWSHVDRVKAELGESATPKKIESGVLKDPSVVKFVKAFYKERYWDVFDCDDFISQAFAENVFLLCVNAGKKRACMVGQEACKIGIDGIFGKQSLKAFSNAAILEVKKFTEIEIRFYTSLAESKPKNKKFLKGWIRRAEFV